MTKKSLSVKLEEQWTFESNSVELKEFEIVIFGFQTNWLFLGLIIVTLINVFIIEMNLKTIFFFPLAILFRKGFKL